MAVRTRALSCGFGDLHAVRALTLDIPIGVVFGLLGPNGAGKTTTMRLLLGLLKPSGGSGEVLGYQLGVHGEAIRQASGVLVEQPAFYERLSAEENLEFAGRAWGVSRSDYRSRARDLLLRFGLYERRRDRVAGWSRGMKQRLAVVRALIHRPRIVFLDEPTSNLDPGAAALLREQIQRVTSESETTVILSTHNLLEAEAMCRLVGIMHRGTMLAVGSPEAMRVSAAPTRLRIQGHGFTEEVVRRVAERSGGRDVSRGDGALFVALHSDADAPAVVRTIIEAGGEIEAVTREASSLEAVYRRIVGGEERS